MALQFFEHPVRLVPRRSVRVLTLSVLLLVVGLVASCRPSSNSTLFQDIRVIDGTGAASYLGSVRVVDSRIVEVGELTPQTGETVVNGGGSVLAPGFIDTHSHHDAPILPGASPSATSRSSTRGTTHSRTGRRSDGSEGGSGDVRER